MAQAESPKLATPQSRQCPRFCHGEHPQEGAGGAHPTVTLAMLRKSCHSSQQGEETRNWVCGTVAVTAPRGQADTCQAHHHHMPPHQLGSSPGTSDLKVQSTRRHLGGWPSAASPSPPHPHRALLSLAPVSTPGSALTNHIWQAGSIIPCVTPSPWHRHPPTGRDSRPQERTSPAPHPSHQFPRDGQTGC